MSVIFVPELFYFFSFDDSKAGQVAWLDLCVWDSVGGGWASKYGLIFTRDDDDMIKYFLRGVDDISDFGQPSQ